MKKIMICIILSCLLAFSSCSFDDNSYETILYRASEDASIFTASQSTSFDGYEYTNTNAPMATSAIVLGKEHELIYLNSAKFALSDMHVHVYGLSGSKEGKVLIDVDTGKIVKYLNIPYEDQLKTEDDYISFIQRLLGDAYVLSEYDYENTTHYYAYSDYGMTSSVVDGFRTAGENERIRHYSFYYTKSIESIPTSEHISAEFSFPKESEPTFTLEVINFECDNNLTTKLSSEINNATNSVDSYLKSILKNEYLIQQLNYSDYMLFEQNGSVYIRLTVEIAFSIKDQSETYTTVVQTITKINAQ